MQLRIKNEVVGRSRSLTLRQVIPVRIWLLLCLPVACSLSSASAQTPKPRRARPPNFDAEMIEGVFFSDPAALVTGELTNTNANQAAATRDASGLRDDAEMASQQTASDDLLSWEKLISPVSLEDLVKGSKLRLENLLSTPAAFAGGGYSEARKEFALQAVLFAVVEEYPTNDVRWRRQAALAKEKMARNSANAKVGSLQSFQSARNGLLDLTDLLNGSSLTGSASQERSWGQLIDRGPLMELLDWAQQDFVNPLSASQQRFESGKDDLKRYAELIAVLGKASIQEEMPDATDQDYVAFANQLIEQARQLAMAVDSNDAELARQSASRLGQSCQDCHDNFR